MKDTMKSTTRRLRFTEQEIRQLEKNPNVLHVTEKSIRYAASFKLAAVHTHRDGKMPQEIFEEAGFPFQIIGKRLPNECMKRWRAVYNLHGEKGLLEERRGKGATGYKTNEKRTMEEQLKRAKARIKLLEVENEFLKKLDALERQVQKKRR